MTVAKKLLTNTICRKHTKSQVVASRPYWLTADYL